MYAVPIQETITQQHNKIRKKTVIRNSTYVSRQLESYVMSKFPVLKLMRLLYKKSDMSREDMEHMSKEK